MPTLPAVFSGGGVRYALSREGILESVVVGTGESLTAPAPLFAVQKSGRWFAVTQMVRDGKVYRALFGSSGVSAEFAIQPVPNALVLRLVAVHGKVEAVRIASVATRHLGTPGPWLAVRSNKRDALALLALEDSVDARLEAKAGIRASVYPAFGMTNRAVAIVAARADRFLEAIHSLEVTFGLPSPMLDGQWAKTSPDGRSSYLFTDLTAANVDQTIRYAKLADLKYILVYAGTWSSSFGSDPINRRNFPDGEASLKTTIAQVHAAGLKVGMHIGTGLIGKNDPLVHPIPDPRLLKDAVATLAEDIGPNAQSLTAADSIAQFPHSSAFYGNRKAGLDVQVDNEILHCTHVGTVPKTFSGCIRGYAGTQPSWHRAGTRIQHLAERAGLYVANLRTSLKDQLADRVASLINQCGFDMIYMDGDENTAANGPGWYWISQEPLAIWKRVRRPLLMLGSGATQWTWHLFAHGTADDFASVQPKLYLDTYKIPVRSRAFRNTLMPADLGWWAILASAPSHRATTPDQAELYAARMLALDAPIGLETTSQRLRQNGRSLEMLRLLGRYERLRLSGEVPASVRAQLRSGEWHMVVHGNRVTLYPTHYVSRTLAAGAGPHTLKVLDPGPAQPLRFRLRALSNVAKPGHTQDITLLGKAAALTLALPAKLAGPGVLARRIPLGIGSAPANAEFVEGPGGVKVAPDRRTPVTDLRSHRALAVTLRVRGAAAPPGAAPGVLNIQLESAGKLYRDYYVDLNFRGTRTIKIPSPSTRRLVTTFRQRLQYTFKAALRDFDYDRIVAVNVRWMRLPVEPVSIKVLSVQALRESPHEAGSVHIGRGRAGFGIPAGLRSGDYAEYWAEGSASVFDPNGHLLRTVAVPTPITLQPGENRVSIRVAPTARVEFTAITYGQPVEFTVSDQLARQLSQ